MFNLLQTFRSSLIGVLMLFVVWQLCANQALAQSIPTNDPTKLGYICQGDPQPTGYSVVGVSAVPSLQCGPFRAALFIEKTKSGLVVCGSSAALAGYTIHTLEYIVAGVAPAPCPGISGQEGWIIEKLGNVNNVCRLTNVIGTQYVVPPGYVVTGFDSSPHASCPGPIVTIRDPGRRATICDPFNPTVFLNAPYFIPIGYSILGSTTSASCPGGGALLIENPNKPFKGTGQWSTTKYSQAPNGQVFLGEFGNETVSFAVSDLSNHSQIRVSFDLYIIRSWDGSGTFCCGTDLWRLAIRGGPTLINTTFSNTDAWLGNKQAYPGGFPGSLFAGRSQAFENNTLGYRFASTFVTPIDEVMDSVYRLSFTFPHTENELVLDFAASGLQDLADESWGIANVSVAPE